MRGTLPLFLGLLAVLACHGAPAAFTALTQLEGTWVGEEDDGSPARVRYQLVAAGTALVEELRMGREPSMISVYYPDADQVMMTHYCTTGNQPRLRTRGLVADLRELDLQYVDATNVLRSTGGMMDRVRIRLTGPETFEQLWGANSVTEAPVRVRFRRAPAAAMPAEPVPSVPPGEDRAGRAFARLAGYAGEWVGTGEGGFEVGLTLRVVSGGTALYEDLELEPGSNMITIYHRDGSQLMLTHYCSSRSQPRMRTTALPEDLGLLRFEGMDATNVLAATGAFMKNAQWRFVDPERFTQTWNQDLVEGQPMHLDFRRGRPRWRSDERR